MDLGIFIVVPIPDESCAGIRRAVSAARRSASASIAALTLPGGFAFEQILSGWRLRTHILVSLTGTCISLTPRFSEVQGRVYCDNRFSGLLVRRQKPLKRLAPSDIV